ncbi:hypothetical protein HHI36_009124 [Cryptolaemus montrouzieri]|uniref:Protein aurora borealis n=1 Tax=Cryptolaemus montrouzieri TaxID=559131 RepID=A0ABD2MUH0_9CUCU
MDFKMGENPKNITPSTTAKRLVEKVINNNSNCDSPFRLLPNFSTPPSRFIKVKNPFDSPLINRLHLPTCSPGPFAKSTPNKDEKFRWSICDISNLKPAEIEIHDTEQFLQTVDPSIESQIQEKISSFFNEHSVVPSPLGQNIDGRIPDRSKETPEKRNINHVSTQTKISLGPILPKKIEEVLASYQNCEIDISDTREIDTLDGETQYLPVNIYHEKLFGFELESPQSSPPMSTGDSPLQFSPLKELEMCSEASFSENGQKKYLNDCALSPITPEAETPPKDRNSYSVVRESRSACRLFFSENMSLDGSENNVVPDMDHISCHGHSFEETVRTSPVTVADSSNEYWDMECQLASKDYENCRMDISFPHTPKSGLFTSQRKRLSDSFKDLHDLLENNEGVNFLAQPCVPSTTSVFSSERSTDMGYHSGSGLVENTWSNSHFIASTPTKKKN